MGSQVGRAWISRPRGRRRPVILLDTHTLVWLAEDGPKLGRKALARIEASEGAVYASAMSYWELGMLTGKRRLALPGPVGPWLDAVLERGGITAIPISTAIAADAGTLPNLAHGDPLDRLLITTARTLRCPLVTSDGEILDYGETGNVLTIDASR